MAFVNAYLTEKEKEEFEKAKIPHPAGIRKEQILIPNSWTVDKEKNIALIHCGYSDREARNEKVFVLIYGKIDKKFVIVVGLSSQQTDPSESTILKAQYEVDLIEKRHINFLDIPDEIKKSIALKQLYHILETALDAYGIGGKVGVLHKVKNTG